MMDFIDLRGASGSAYRFRRWVAGAAHPPIAGNYVLARTPAGAVTVLMIGLANDLSQLDASIRREGADVFTRFNVSRAQRRIEHDDLVAQYPGAEIGPGEA